MILGGRNQVPATERGNQDSAAASSSGATVKRTRALLRLSQARMAQHMNLPIRWVQDLEQGRNGMTAANRLLFKTMEMFPDAVRQAARAIRRDAELTSNNDVSAGESDVQRGRPRD